MIRFDAAIKLGAFAYEAAFESPSSVSLFGRSGSGKTVTLGLLAGLLRPDRGVIVVDDRVLVDTRKHIFVPKHDRRIGLVYQDAQLFPHLTVRQNLLFGRWFAPRVARAVEFDAVVETLGIGHILGRRPGRLSGGERQRVAIGRALLSSPRLLLMDEPLAALDDERKAEVLTLIERLRDGFKIPIAYVSHSIDEVARLAAPVVVFSGGKVIASGPVDEVFGPRRVQAEESRFARSSVVTGRIVGMNPEFGLTEIAHPGGSIWLVGPAGSPGSDVRVVVKATDVTVATERPRDLSIRSVLTGRIAAIEQEDGPLAAVTIDLPVHGHVVALVTRMAADELGLAPGCDVFALMKTVALDERGVATGGK
jgi:molybdate transport system ATP-binding protein